MLLLLGMGDDSCRFSAGVLESANEFERNSAVSEATTCEAGDISRGIRNVEVSTGGHLFDKLLATGPHGE